MLDLLLRCLSCRDIIGFFPCDLIQLFLRLLARSPKLFRVVFNSLFSVCGIISPNRINSPLIPASVSATIVLSSNIFLSLPLLSAGNPSTPACSPSQTSRPFQKTVSLLYPVRTPHIPASCNASYHIRRSSDVNSAVPVPISSYFPLISAHAFCACRVCVKCAQTQISRLKNFIFQSSASVSTDIFA